jgi:hypothetical protein
MTNESLTKKRKLILAKHPFNLVQSFFKKQNFLNLKKIKDTLVVINS